MPNKLTLRPYQVKTSKFLVSAKRAICAHEMGLGKTACALDALGTLTFNGDPYFPTTVLILCPKVALYVWQTECIKWGSICPTIIRGKPEERRELWKNSSFVLVTYDILKRDIALQNNFVSLYWDVIICDEAHKFRNRKTLTYKAVKKLHSPYMWLLTGTPASRGAQDLWSLLNILKPKLFSSYWKFVNTFCYVERTQFGTEVTGTRNAEALRVVLASRMIRRTKKSEGVVGKVRQFLPIDMTPTQKRIYNELSNDLMAELNVSTGRKILIPSPLTQLIRHRQLLVTPKLLDPGLEYGAGLEAIGEYLEGSNSKHVVIFTPFAKAIPFIEYYLMDLDRGYKFIRLQGGMDPEEVGEAIETFKRPNPDSDNKRDCIAICTIKFAQSFSLETCSTAFFLGYEWDPAENQQAEDRIHRMTSLDLVNIYYVKHQNTIDGFIMGTLGEKQHNVNRIFVKPINFNDFMHGEGNVRR